MSLQYQLAEDSVMPALTGDVDGFCQLASASTAAPASSIDSATANPIIP